MSPAFLIAFLATLFCSQAGSPRKDIPSIAKAANGAVVSIIMSDKDGQDGWSNLSAPLLSC